ncbi:hypothetical protein EHM82_04155 [bacterium]|nr:MAG: hypothetical protein EHM82_04155 [bacterium]
MKARFIAFALVAALFALPVLAQDIPIGDDVWDTVGGGATDVTLTSGQWRALCGVSVPDTAVQLKGFNLAGQGTGDTVVARLNHASLPADGDVADVNIQLKALSMVNDGSHPCSPLTLRVREDGSIQQIGTMTIVRTSSAGGTFSANVPVSAIIRAVDSSGNVVGSTPVNGVLGDDSASPWSYQPPTTGAPKVTPWYPGVDPITRKPVRVCRRGNKILPARHCYWPPPKCGVVVVADPVPVDSETDAAVAQPVTAEPCSVEAEPVGTKVD